MNIIKRGDKYRVEVCVNYQRRSKTFKTKKEATAWGNAQEDHGILPSKTLGDAIRNYKPICERMKSSQSRLSRLSAMERHAISSLRLESLSNADITSYREDRLASVSGPSVRAEMFLISTILRLCRNEWGWMHHNPIASVRKPPPTIPRRRGISQDEIDQIVSNLSGKKHGEVVSRMFRLAIETGLRLSEITGLQWSDILDKTLVLIDTKNGDDRKVPLSPVAREILSDRGTGRVFNISSHNASTYFRRHSINGVHFHDARSEAITRLSKKLDVMALAKIIGHRDLKSLMIYYAESEDDMADRL